MARVSGRWPGLNRCVALLKLEQKEFSMHKPDRVTKFLLALLVMGIWGLLLRSIIQLPNAQAQSKSEKEQSSSAAQVLRARGLIIVDERGRERIFIGSPVPDPKEGARRKPATGITINDPAGFERFGLGLFEDNHLIMGFDAPPGTGDERNRERINISADAKGGGYIRFLNRKTSVPGLLQLGDDDRLYLDFVDVQPSKVVRRRIGFSGEQKIEEPR